MSTPLAALGRRCNEWLYRRLNVPGDVRPSATWQFLASLRRRAGNVYRRWMQTTPVLLTLDQPVRLSGCGAITGWAVSRHGPIPKIEIRADGRTIAVGRPTEHRADVAERFPFARSHGATGFRLAPSTDAIHDGRYLLRVSATDMAGNQAEQFAVLEVRDYRIADANLLAGHLRGSNREYQYWIATQRLTIGPPTGPLISVVVPIYRPRADHFQAAIESVMAQSYANWELCLCDDGSRQPGLTQQIQSWSARDKRIRLVQYPWNRGISAATNSAIGLGRGDYVAFLDQDDLLAPDALAEIANTIVKDPADLFYSDEDRLDELGCRVEPIFKPDWSPDLLLSRMYLGHLCVYRRAFLLQVGLCRSEFDGTQDYDLALRAAERSARIVHVPKVLYHWRIGGNSAGSTFNRRCHDRGRIAIAEALERRQLNAAVSDGPTSCTFHVRYRCAARPLVSILIPTRDNARLLRRCLQGIRRRTAYSHYEILVIDNGSRRPETRRFFDRCGERILRLDIPFNHSRLNNLAARRANGSLLLLLNDDTEVITADWLTAMVEQAERPEVGAVGAWLFQLDGRTQHAGIVLGTGKVATPLHGGLLRDGLDRGAIGLIRNVSAVTGACLMIRRQLYLDIGGLDEESLPTSFNDVDLCLRLRKAGYRIVQTPLARLYHHETATRRIGGESPFIKTMQARWGAELRRDPFWNPNLPHGNDAVGIWSFHWSREALTLLSSHSPSIECPSGEAVPLLEGARHERDATSSDRGPVEADNRP